LLRHLSLLVLVIAAAIAAGSSATTTAVAATPPADAVRLGLSMQMYGGRISSLAQAQSLAQAHSVISMRSEQLGPWGPAMHAANPSLRLYVYLNGMFAQAPEGDRFPKAWYMKDRSGHRIRSRGWGNWLMDPRGRAPFSAYGMTFQSWKDYVAERCRLLVAGGQFDGCFLDMLGAAPLSPGYLRGRQAVMDQESKRPWAPSDYIELTGSVGRAVEAYVGKGAIGNGLGWGGNFYSVPTRNLLGATDISLAEVWMRSPGSSPSTFPRVDRWKQEVQMLIDANRAGHSVEATMKVWTGATAAQLHAWRTFGEASFLIGNSGSSWFEFSSGRATLAWHEESRLAGIDLGAALDTHESVDGYYRDGVYQRRFTQGIALVNPGDRAVTVSFGDRYRTPSGDAVTSLTLEPHSGQVLLAR